MHRRVVAIHRSMLRSIGYVAFGMSDGAVTVTGLVFGVAAGTNDPRIVLLAGATGAISGAVSMMAGAYLEAASGHERRDALLRRTRRRALEYPEPFIQRARSRMGALGYSDEEIEAVIAMYRRNPEALVDHVIAYEVGSQGPDAAPPIANALWMFIAVIVASWVPVVPFAFFDIDTARWVALGLTGTLMVGLGYARGRIGQVNVWWAIGQTVGIAGIAAVAGITIGTAVTG